MMKEDTLFAEIVCNLYTPLSSVEHPVTGKIDCSGLGFIAFIYHV